MPLSKEKMKIYMARRREEIKKQKLLAAEAIKRGGPNIKGASISDQFNPIKENNLSSAEEKRAMGQALSGMEAEDLDLLGGDMNAYKMLQDMRHVYKKVKGRAKLLKLVKSDDKQFMSMVKELIKIEGALAAAKVKKYGGGNGSGDKGFLVILKGLDDGDKIEKPSETGVNLAQITNALNPTSSVSLIEPEASSDSPPELYRPVDTIETENIESEGESLVEQPAGEG